MQRAELEALAAKSGCSLTREIETLIQLGAVARDLMQADSPIGIYEVIGYARVVGKIREALTNAGEDPRQWPDYRYVITENAFRGVPLAVEAMQVAIEMEVEKRYQDALGFLAEHGPAIAKHGYVRQGRMSDEEFGAARAAAEQHRALERYVAKIRINRWKLQHGPAEVGSEPDGR